jgi:peptidoglycan/LPS O-acetylase OafA/YrhL
MSVGFLAHSFASRWAHPAEPGTRRPTFDKISATPVACSCDDCGTRTVLAHSRLALLLRDARGSVTGTQAREVDAEFPCIDGLRAFAAFSVVLCHTIQVSSLITSGLGSYLSGLRSGVQIFFVISGFVLYRPFVRGHLSGGRGPKLGAYFRRRFLRIFPGYWLALTVGVFALGVVFLSNRESDITNYLLVQSYFPVSFFDGLGPAWTLVVEVSFYVFLPFYALARHRPLVAELTGCGILLVVGLASTAFVAFGHAPSAVGVLPANLVPFALGMLLAVVRGHIKPQSKAWHWTQRAVARSWPFWLLAAFAFSATVWAVHYPALLSFLGVSGATTMWYQLLIDLMGLCVVLPAVFGDQRRGAGRRILRARPIVYIGTISYGIYLWHVPVMDKVLDVEGFGPGPPRVNFLTLVLMTLVFTGIVASASWYLVERPMITFSRRPRLVLDAIAKWRGRGSPPAASSNDLTVPESSTSEEPAVALKLSSA